MTRVFGARAAEEGAALAKRAPVDLRVNALKATRAAAAEKLAHFHPVATPFSPLGLRLPAPEGGGRQPNVEAEAAHGQGWIEVQDEGSQIAALMAGAKPGEQALDLCAGAGGKTLALAAAMENAGEILAYDDDKRQLRPIFERLARAGASNVQVMTAGDRRALRALGPRFDCVVVDAPCTGSGTWRRRPDAKWRLKPKQLAQRIKDQRAVFELARGLVKPGGRLLYVTCSVLAEENTDQVAWFLGEAPDFALVPYAEAWRASFATDPPASADGRDDALLLTPARHGTDGFYVAALRRAS
jgi:16S rRNA (cytosine967-C5)-methyltransferase